MARKEKAVAPAPPPPAPANANKDLIGQYQALVVSLNTLANAAQTASYAAGQYFQNAFPGVDIGSAAFFPAFAAGVSAPPPVAAVAHDDEEDGNPAKRRKRTKNATPKDPNAPKKPLTAYFAFAKVARPEVVSEMKNATNKEITEELAARWANMKETGEQQPFRDQYAIEMKTYTKTLEAYKKALGGAALPSDAVEPEEEEEEEPPAPPPKPVTPKSTSKSKKEKEKESASSRKKGKDKAAPKEKSRKRSAAAAKETNTPPASNGEEEQPAPATKSPRKRKRKTAD